MLHDLEVCATFHYFHDLSFILNFFCSFASNLVNRFKKKPSESDMSQLPQKSSGDLAISESSQTLQKNEEKFSDSGDNLRPSEGVSKIGKLCIRIS